MLTIKESDFKIELVHNLEIKPLKEKKKRDSDINIVLIVLSHVSIAFIN